MRRRRSASCSSETLMWKGRIASLSAAATRFAGRLTVPTAAILLTTVPTKRRRSWSISSGILFESMDEIPSVHPSRSRCRPHALLIIQPDGHSDTEAREQQRKRVHFRVFLDHKRTPHSHHVFRGLGQKERISPPDKRRRAAQRAR